MMKILTVTSDVEARFEDRDHIRGLACGIGVPLRDAFKPGNVMLVNPSHRILDVCDVGVSLVCSARFVAALHSGNVECEVFPVRIRLNENEWLSTFSFVNLLAVRDCFDWDHSIYRRDEDYAERVTR